MGDFNVGDKVDVNMGADRWQRGEVIGVRPSRLSEESVVVDVDLPEMQLHSVHPSRLRAVSAQ